MFGIRRSAVGAAVMRALVGLSVFGAAAVHAQTPAAPEPERRLSITDAVQLALEQNADLEVVRLTPQLQDLSISQAHAAWAPTITSLFQGSNRDNPVNSFLSGGQNKIENNRPAFNVGVASALPWYGASYSVGWDNSRATTNNMFANFSPQTGSDLHRQLHAAAAAQLRDRQNAPAAAGLAQEPRDLRRAGARGRRQHDAFGEEHLLGPGLRDQQPRRAAAVTRSGATLAQGEPRPRGNRHDGTHRHRAGRGRGGAARGGRHRRRGRHRPRRGRSCARSSTASTPPTSGTRGSCRPTRRPSRRCRST